MIDDSHIDQILLSEFGLSHMDRSASSCYVSEKNESEEKSLEYESETGTQELEFKQIVKNSYPKPDINFADNTPVLISGGGQPTTDNCGTKVVKLYRSENKKKSVFVLNYCKHQECPRCYQSHSIRLANRNSERLFSIYKNTWGMDEKDRYIQHVTISFDTTVNSSDLTVKNLTSLVAKLFKKLKELHKGKHLGFSYVWHPFRLKKEDPDDDSTSYWEWGLHLHAVTNLVLDPDDVKELSKTFKYKSVKGLVYKSIKRLNSAEDVRRVLVYQTSHALFIKNKQVLHHLGCARSSYFFAFSEVKEKKVYEDENGRYARYMVTESSVSESDGIRTYNIEHLNVPMLDEMGEPIFLKETKRSYLFILDKTVTVSGREYLRYRDILIDKQIARMYSRRDAALDLISNEIYRAKFEETIKKLA